MSFDKRLKDLENRLHKLKVDCPKNEQEKKREIEKAYLISIDLLNDVIDELNEVKSIKIYNISDEEFNSFLNNEKEFKKFVDLECKLLKIRGCREKLRDEVKEYLSNADLSNHTDLNLNNLIKEIKHIKIDLDKDNKNKLFKHLEWIKKGNVKEICKGSGIIAVDLIASETFPIFAPVFNSVSVPAGIQLCKEAIGEFKEDKDSNRGDNLSTTFEPDKDGFKVGDEHLDIEDD